MGMVGSGSQAPRPCVARWVGTMVSGRFGAQTDGYFAWTSSGIDGDGPSRRRPRPKRAGRSSFSSNGAAPGSKAAGNDTRLPQRRLSRHLRRRVERFNPIERNCVSGWLLFLELRFPHAAVLAPGAVSVLRWFDFLACVVVIVVTMASAKDRWP